MAEFTTNDHDQQQAQALKERLKAGSVSNPSGSSGSVPNVEIAPGKHKYVLIHANDEYFVVSRENAAYHRNAAEPFVEKLERWGYQNIEVTGGGRIDFQQDTIAIYGFSYGFGKADHEISRTVVLEDERYKDFTVTISDEGY